MAVSVRDTRPDLVSMLLTGGVIGPLNGMMIGGLAGGMAGIRADASIAVCMSVVVAAVIILEGVAPASYAKYVWSKT